MVFEGLPYRYAIMHVCMYTCVHVCMGLCVRVSVYTCVHVVCLYVWCVYVWLFVRVFVCVFLHQVFAVNRDKDQSKGACWMKRALRPN